MRAGFRILAIICVLMFFISNKFVFISFAKKGSLNEITTELETKTKELEKRLEEIFAFKPNVFRDIEWGTRIEDFKGMVLLDETEMISLYKKQREELTIGDLCIESKLYRFYDNKLLSIIVTTKGEDNFKALKKLAFKEFSEGIQFDNSIPEWFWVDIIGGGVRLLRYEEPLEKATLCLLSTEIYQQQKEGLGELATPVKKRQAPQELQWLYVIGWKGNGAKTTEPFVIQGKMWRIRWKNSEYVLQIYLHNIDGDLVSVPVNTAEEGSDVSYVYEKGEFYLTINAVGKWEIDIEEKVGES